MSAESSNTAFLTDDARTFEIIQTIVRKSQEESPLDKKSESEKLKWLRHHVSRMQLPYYALQYLQNPDTQAEFSYRFLLFKNPYLQLYRYLHSKHFRAFQTEVLGLLTGLYAYIDRQNQYFRYLTSYQNHQDDVRKAPHHFLISSYYKHNGAYYLEDRQQYETIMRIAYLSNKRENPSNLDFKQILRKEVGYQYKLTPYESTENLLYVPSGEMDACILCWFLLMQEYDTTRKPFVAKVWQADNTDENWTELKQIPLSLRWKKFVSVFFPDGHHLAISMEHANDGIDRWLYRLGLVTSGSADRLSHRGRACVGWLQAYLRRLTETANSDAKVLLERIKDDRSGNDYWLDPSYLRFQVVLSKTYGITVEAYRDMIDAFVNASLDDAADHRTVILQMLRLLSVWQEGAGNYDQRLSYFRDRCRFDLVSQFYTRSLDRSDIQATPQDITGWLAIPILHDYKDQLGLRNDGKLAAVGFFIGQITEDQGVSESFLNGDSKKLCPLFYRRINRLKTVINILAQVENQAIYYNSIVEEASTYRSRHDNERIITHSNKFVFGKLSNGLRDLRASLEEIETSRSVKQQLLKLNVQAELLRTTDEMRGFINRSEYIPKETSDIEVRLSDFLYYLFILHRFSTEFGQQIMRNLTREQTQALSAIFEIRSFHDLKYNAKQIDVLTAFLAEDSQVNISIPATIFMTVPRDNTKGFALYFINFLEIIRNFYEHWISSQMSKETYHFRVEFKDKDKTLFIHQFKDGAQFPLELHYDKGLRLNQLRMQYGKYDWRVMSESSYNTGLRGVKTFCYEYLTARFQILQSSKEFPYRIKSRKPRRQPLIYLKIAALKTHLESFRIYEKEV